MVREINILDLDANKITDPVYVEISLYPHKKSLQSLSFLKLENLGSMDFQCIDKND